MSLTRMTHSERESYARREKAKEEAMAKEFERTVAAANEHRQAVSGDAAGPNGQLTSARHDGGVTNSFGAPIDPSTGVLLEQSSVKPVSKPKPEAKSEAKS